MKIKSLLLLFYLIFCSADIGHLHDRQFFGALEVDDYLSVYPEVDGEGDEDSLFTLDGGVTSENSPLPFNSQARPYHPVSSYLLYSSHFIRGPPGYLVLT